MIKPLYYYSVAVFYLLSIYLIPCRSPEAQTGLERASLVGKPVETLDSVAEGEGSCFMDSLDEAFEPDNKDEDTARLWGVKQSYAKSKKFQVGDVFLFYTGNFEYEYAAIVRGGASSPAVAEYLYESSDDGAASDWHWPLCRTCGPRRDGSSSP